MGRSYRVGQNTNLPDPARDALTESFDDINRRLVMTEQLRKAIFTVTFNLILPVAFGTGRAEVVATQQQLGFAPKGLAIVGARLFVTGIQTPLTFVPFIEWTNQTNGEVVVTNVVGAPVLNRDLELTLEATSGKQSK